MQKIEQISHVVFCIFEFEMKRWTTFMFPVAVPLIPSVGIYGREEECWSGGSRSWEGWVAEVQGFQYGDLAQFLC